MTKHVVTAFYNGTHVRFAIPAQTPEVAVEKVRRTRLGRKASAFLVHTRKGKMLVYATHA